LVLPNSAELCSESGEEVSREDNVRYGSLKTMEQVVEARKRKRYRTKINGL